MRLIAHSNRATPHLFRIENWTFSVVIVAVVDADAAAADVVVYINDSRADWKSFNSFGIRIHEFAYTHRTQQFNDCDISINR